MTFAFIHIPKTAGTSVKQQLLREKEVKVLNVGNHTLFGDRFGGDAALLRDTLAEYNGFMGHVVYQAWWAAVPDCLTSVVRDPIPRAISLTNFILGTPENNLHGQLTQLGFKTAFREVQQFRMLLSDSQYRCVFGRDDHAKLNLRRASDATIADRLTRHHYLLGHFEGFADYCTAMNDRFGTHLSADVVRKTRDKSADYVFDDEDIALLREVNRADQLLFDYVKARGVVIT